MEYDYYTNYDFHNYCILLVRKNEDRNYSKHAVIVGILFSLLASLKCYVDSFYTDNFKILKLIVVFSGLFFLFKSFLRIVFSVICSNSFLPNDIFRNPTKKQLIIIFIASFLLIILGTVPYFILCYPGCLTYDSEIQIQQALGLAPLSNHHPIIHTFIIKLSFIISEAIFDADFNISVAVYSSFQLIFHQQCLLLLLRHYIRKRLIS